MSVNNALAMLLVLYVLGITTMIAVQVTNKRPDLALLWLLLDGVCIMALASVAKAKN